MGRLVFVTGGARSGKSAYAEKAARETGRPVVYLATMEAGDDELRARIARHRAHRPPEWSTVEEPLDVLSQVENADGGHCILLDCLSLWVTNLLLSRVTDPDRATPEDWERALEWIVGETGRLLEAQRAREGPLIAVTNEVGSGIVPLGALSRAYRDTLGLVNQRFAAAADEAALLVSGLPLRLK